MKKIFLIFITILVTSNYCFAEIIDDSISKELGKDEFLELDMDFKLKSFESCSDLEETMETYIKDYWESNKNRYRRPFIRGWIKEINVDEAFVDNASIDETLEMQADFSLQDNSQTLSRKSTDWNYSKTNIQVLWVDEADIIKTDWNYIYYYNDKWEYNKDKYIYVVESESLELVKKIKVPSFFYDTKIYIDEDSLVVLASWYSQSTNKYKSYYINRNNKTYVIVFDIKDKKNPELKKLYVSDWTMSKSRKIWRYLYVVSNNYFNFPYTTFKNIDDIKIDSDKIIPKKIDISKTSIKEEQNLKLNGKKYPFKASSWNVAKCSDIQYILPDKETLEKYDFNPSYNIISIIDTKDTSSEVKNKVIAGNSSELYMSLDNLYITDRVYSSQSYKCEISDICIAPYYYWWTTNTMVHKLSINWDSLNYLNSNMIPWSPLNQYSMDEKDWLFRIITSINSWWKVDEMHTDLYILDKNLKLHSSLTKLAPWETFRSSRYMWDKLFLVTFQQVDPLFVIDLSDSKNPKILWELKMPGYSTYLRPYDENHIIGLGYETYQNQWWGVRNGWIKLDLYEIDYNKKPEKSDSWDEEIEKLISGWCEAIRVDGDWNTCNLNKNKTAYDVWCTEMDSTIEIDLPICVKWNWQKSIWDIYVSQKYTKSFWDSWSNSEALRNPRMFVWNSKDNLLLLPATIYTNESKTSYNHTDFFAWILALNIDKEKGISEKYRITHINSSNLEEKREKDCSWYLKKKEEKLECKKLINGDTYCPSKRNYYIPPYCYEDSTIGSYLASKSWNYRDSFIKRALWIWNNAFAISDDKMSKHNLESWNEEMSLEMR